RTALVKANPGLDFSGDMPQRLMAIEVAGVYPTVGEELCLPAPNDCVWDEMTNKVHRVQPVPLETGEGVDFPLAGLDPVRLTREQAEEDFKAKAIRGWWPLSKYEEWLITPRTSFRPDWFSTSFLHAAMTEARDHVSLDAGCGAAAEGQLFATAGLNIRHLPRFFPKNLPHNQEPKSFAERFAEITLSARVSVNDQRFDSLDELDIWRPLGGERRLVHWERSDGVDLWNCPDVARSALESATAIRMFLTTPAIFSHGWRPDWLDANTLTGKPIDDGPTLKL